MSRRPIVGEGILLVRGGRGVYFSVRVSSFIVRMSQQPRGQATMGTLPNYSKNRSLSSIEYFRFSGL
ncbi:hypothetical protein [Rhodococcus sp. IEGM 1379]|uniref:hypothetical protein n=1 Tax=Rhodococcus sp. IEGM 1379 TaxID=3047086 RepID=UPI0024B79BB8|nr:hypothetical protein [Rhodococcus sp. IEGM 1379]MDI9918173.1 hypothetical protein [Rhodococcus sp. IEGM 1379]